MPQKVILDVDTGHDDAVAILLAGHHPALELVAVTACHGNAPLDITLENTLRTMDIGRLSHVPVYSGATTPLICEPVPSSPIQAAFLPYPPSTTRPQSKRAVDFLIDYYMGPDGPDTILVPLAPHTNIALALQIEPRLKERIPQIVTMGGAYLKGNSTPSAEFNIYADPEAARVVFKSGIPITMIGLEVTAQAEITLDDADKLEALGKPWSKAAAEAIRPETRLQMEYYGSKGGQIFDACAVAAVIDPSILQAQSMFVDIELTGELTRGRTVADISGVLHKPANVLVGTGINRQRFMDIMFEGLK